MSEITAGRYRFSVLSDGKLAYHYSTLSYSVSFFRSLSGDVVRCCMYGEMKHVRVLWNVRIRLNVGEEDGRQPCGVESTECSSLVK